MKKVQINLYSVNELNEDARAMAIEQHKEFLLSIYSDEDFDESLNMTYSNYEDGLDNEYIIEEIEANDYLYFFNGELANVTYYCDKHEKAGTNELKLFNEVYIINKDEVK